MSILWFIVRLLFYLVSPFLDAKSNRQIEARLVKIAVQHGIRWHIADCLWQIVNSIQIYDKILEQLKLKIGVNINEYGTLDFAIER
jgi:hypothetical protein